MSKTKVFVIFAIFYFQYRLYVLMTGATNVSINAIAEQLSEIINDSPAFNLNLLLWIY